MNYPNTYVIFDIETTGFVGTTDKCTEIAAIKVVEGKKIAEFNVLLNWDIPIPEKITEITGITKDLLDKEGITPARAITEFLNFISGAETVIGHNVLRFDIPFLHGNFGFPAIMDLMNKCIDTAAIFKARQLKMLVPEHGTLQFMKDILNARHPVKYSVDTCCIEFKIDKSKVTQHRALGDCILTNEIYKNLCLTKN